VKSQIGAFPAISARPLAHPCSKSLRAPTWSELVFRPSILARREALRGRPAFRHHMSQSDRQWPPLIEVAIRCTGPCNTAMTPALRLSYTRSLTLRDTLPAESDKYRSNASPPWPAPPPPPPETSWDGS